LDNLTIAGLNKNLVPLSGTREISRGTTLLLTIAERSVGRFPFWVCPRLANGRRFRRTYWQPGCVQLAAPEGFSASLFAPALTIPGFADAELMAYSFPSSLLLWGIMPQKP